MGTIERIMKVMIYICRVRYTTMSELADKFGVSIRTIKRDIDELGYIIPLETKSGRYYGGVYVMNNYKWDKVYMGEMDIELLKKIKRIGKSGKKLVFSEDEMDRIEKIIATYSMPPTKKDF